MDPNLIYRKQIKRLDYKGRLRLMALIAKDLAREEISSNRRSLLELDGLGQQVWADIDAMAYVNELRDEWSQGRDIR